MAAGFRSLAAIIAAALVAFLLLNAVELFSEVVYPAPSGATMEEMCQHVAGYPHWILALVVPAWGVTAFVSTWIAQRIGNRGCAILIGLLLLAAVVFNISMLPYPIWFKIVNLLVIPAAVVLGCGFTFRRKTLAINPAQST